MQRSLVAYKKQMKITKTNNWREFVQTEGKADLWGAIYKFCKGRKGWGDVTSALKEDDRVTTTWRESAELLLEEFFPAQTDKAHQVGEDTYNAAPNEFFLEEIECAVRRIKMRRATGLDGLNPEIVRYARCAVPTHMMEIYNDCL